jgi:hypothetical protein
LEVTGKIIPEPLRSDLFKVEWNLATRMPTFDCHGPDQEVAKLIERRKSCRSPLEVVDAYGDLAETIRALDEHVENRGKININEKYLELTVVLERFGLYCDIAAVSSRGPTDYMNAVIQSDTISEWKSIENLLGRDALERIVISSDWSRATPKVVALISEVSPVVGCVIRSANEGSKSRVPLDLSRFAKGVQNDPEPVTLSSGEVSAWRNQYVFAAEPGTGNWKAKLIA